MTLVDTIAAIATPPGHGAIAVVRCSGPQARQIAAAVFRSSGPLVDRQATYGRIIDARGELVDRGLAIAMDAPRTVTGEDIVELHVHGSPVAARETLGALIAAGARLADPGEFTRRSFLNGKMDLSAAEAVADIIAAESRAGVRAAAANLAGGLRRIIDDLRSDLQAVLEEIAGALDFPDEVPMLDVQAACERVERVGDQLAALAGDAERGRMVREGISVAIVGPPNAGKSSLLNALVGEERAIVSPIAGTTRDTIEERFILDGVVVRVIDTAGLRASGDEIERIGIERAKAALAMAAIAIVVVDGSRQLEGEARELLRSTRDRARVVVFNKRDLGDGGVRLREAPERDAIVGSVLDADSLGEIRHAIARVGWGGTLVDVARPHLASARHVNAVARARESLDHARATLGGGFPIDLITADLANAVGALGEITGGTVSEDVLDGIFARFCVGK